MATKLEATRPSTGMRREQAFAAHSQKKFETGKLTDFEVKGYDSNTAIKCHKIILSFQSVYFDEKFNANSKASEEMVDFPDDVVRSVIKFMYYSKCDLTDDNVLDVYSLSCIWSCTDLIEKTQQFIQGRIKVSNVISYHEAAVEQKDNLIREACSCFIRKNYKQMYNKLDGLSKQSFETLLKCDDFDIDNEDIVFKSIQHWKRKNRISDISSLCNLVRLAYCTEDYLEQTISKYEPFTKVSLQEEVALALQFIRTGQTYETQKVKRSWKTQSSSSSPSSGHQLVMINKKNQLCTLTSPAAITTRSWSHVTDLPTWFDGTTGRCSVLGVGVVYVGADDKHTGNQAVLIKTHTATHTSLCTLPNVLGYVGVGCGGGWLFVAGGCSTPIADDKFVWSSTPYYLSLCDENGRWINMHPLMYTIALPIVTYIQGKLYVVGGWKMINRNVVRYSHVQIYDSLSATCRLGTPAPQPCDSMYYAGCVYRGEITVFTDKLCMMYNTHTDTWAQHTHNIHDINAIKPVVCDDQLYVCASNGSRRTVYMYNVDTHTYTHTNIDVTQLWSSNRFFSV